MPASVEDRMRKLGFPGTKPPDTIPTEESKPEMAKKKEPESKPKMKPAARRKSAAKSRSTSSKERG